MSMFDGVPVEQFHQFISTPNSSSFIQTTPPISTNSSAAANLNFLSFDPLLFPPPSLPTHHHQALFQSNHFVRTPTPTPTRCCDDQYNIIATEDDDHKVVDHIIKDQDSSSWSDDEVIQLLRIKSTTTASDQNNNWFSCREDFTNWEHVSRKLAEMGYKRSAEKCKEKFEEETFNSTIGYNKNNSSSSRYLTSEEDVDGEQHDDDLYINNAAAAPQSMGIHDHHAAAAAAVTIQPPAGNLLFNHQQVHDQKEAAPEEQINSSSSEGQKGHLDHKDPADDQILMMAQQPSQDHDSQVTTTKSSSSSSKKRKRKHSKQRFKMVKGLCVDLVNKMMAQQQEMHKKLLEDMANRDEEKIKREEAWRKEEMERVKREIHIREQEREMARDRQSTITDFLNKITSLDHQKLHIPFDITINFQDYATTYINKQQPMPMPMPLLSDHQITKQPSSSADNEKINIIPELEDPRPTADQPTKDEIGKRWPREEVLALINIRSNVNNNNNNNCTELQQQVHLNHHHQGHEYNNIASKGGSSSSATVGGGSLWERISQGMQELGYKRSAKRCKEKWENINKYFRKTKDANKKRSLDSRTCPYYHELSKLYNQEKQQQHLPSNSISSSLHQENN